MIDSPLIDVLSFKDIKCTNPLITYSEDSLSGAEIIARTINGTACGFSKSLGSGSLIHLGTWIGFDTEGHKAVYEAILNRSGARLRLVSTTNDKLVIRERFTPDHSAILFIGNYYNEDQTGKITYTHPESGENISVPYVQENLLWPALYGILTPVFMQVIDGIKILHSTSDILGLRVSDNQLEITLFGDRDLAGELIFEGAAVNRITSAAIPGQDVQLVRKGGRIALLYNHTHRTEMILNIQITK
jgi:hypothetical protein